MRVILSIAALAVWAAISVFLIMHLWLKHRQESRRKKLLWSLILLMPVVGWVFYGGFYNPPERGPTHWQDRHGRRIDFGSFGG